MPVDLATFTAIHTALSLAPTLAEPPFVAAQGVALVLFVVLGFAAIRSFRRAGTQDAGAGI